MKKIIISLICLVVVVVVLILCMQPNVGVEITDISFEESDGSHIGSNGGYKVESDDINLYVVTIEVKFENKSPLRTIKNIDIEFANKDNLSDIVVCDIVQSTNPKLYSVKPFETRVERHQFLIGVKDYDYEQILEELKKNEFYVRETYPKIRIVSKDTIKCEISR